jgi:hypothetical protein
VKPLLAVSPRPGVRGEEAAGGEGIPTEQVQIGSVEYCDWFLVRHHQKVGVAAAMIH